MAASGDRAHPGFRGRRRGRFLRPRNASEPAAEPGRGFYIWLDTTELDRLDAVKEPDASYSEVILRLAEKDEVA
jgi:hypothetical protein